MKHVKKNLSACALTLCLLAAMAACTDSPANGSETDSHGATAPTTEPSTIETITDASSGDTAEIPPADSEAPTEQTTEAITLPPDILETGGDIKLETDGNGNIVFPDDVFE